MCPTQARIFGDLQSKASRLVRFSCWWSKVMAAIGKLPETLADGCIVITMQRKTALESCERLKHLDSTVLRRQCARFVRDHVEDIAQALPETPGALNDRAADIWEPLLVLADLAGGDWPRLGREAAVKLSTRAQENSPIGSLLLDLVFGFELQKDERLFSRTLVEWRNRRAAGRSPSLPALASGAPGSAAGFGEPAWLTPIFDRVLSLRPEVDPHTCVTCGSARRYARPRPWRSSRTEPPAPA